ncbi:MAG: LysM peptidoglycan-binding domain-containing protein [Cytophagales bacterium]|nr:LysM peptidoglycan-binding domain-containing protein [Cytophagales bacterium]
MLHVILITLVSTFAPDSLRMEMINGKPHVVHQVGEKETLYSLSRRYGTTVADILTQNPTADAGLEIGQILRIPYAAKSKPAPPVRTAEGLIHRVASKETLFSIARQYNVSVDDIVAWNKLREMSLAVGQEILIRNKVSEVPVEVKPVVVSGAKTHTVAPKETLYSIARMYGMTVPELKEWNGIAGTELKIGQVLRVTASVSAPVTPVATPAPVVISERPAAAMPKSPAVETIRISENVSGSNEYHETGFAALLAGTEGNRKYLGQHRTIKPGTILKIRNLTTNQEVFVRITGPPASADEGTIILISRSAYDRLAATEEKFRADITYYK